MYRCTECYTEYEVCPEFCDCGNDTFEEVVDNSYYQQEEEYYEEPAPPPRPKKKKRPLTEDEIEELREMEAEKKKSLTALGVSLVLCLVVLVLPPYMPKKMDKVAKQVAASNAAKLPSVNSYWDTTTASPMRKADATSNLPVLNKSMNYLSPVMKEYLKTVGSFITKKWDSSIVVGSGECYAEFTIDKEGNFISRGIIKKSENDTLNDSVLLLLGKVTSFDIPPDEYKGERIIISFKKDSNGTRKVYYPTVK